MSPTLRIGQLVRHDKTGRLGVVVLRDLWSPDGYVVLFDGLEWLVSDTELTAYEELSA